MIAPDEIRERALRRYRDYLAAIVEGGVFFPLDIPFAKVKAGEAAARWNELGSELALLKKEGAENRPGRSYVVEWEERRDRLASAQSFPSRIYFPDEPSYLSFLGKAREVARFREDIESILAVFPALGAWATARPALVVERSGDWPRILAALKWLVSNPSSGLYLREVPAVEDTKFIERNKPMLRALLDFLAPSDDARRNEKSFEARCGLKTIAPSVRVRLLDRGIAAARFSGVDDLSLPADRLGTLDFPEIERVLVIENKASFGNVDVFLTVPELRGTMAIFGSGYASRALAGAAWLASRRVFYWGDIDSHGLRILGALRSAFPRAESVLMDGSTFDRFPEYRSDAPPDEATEPSGLSASELALFRRLVSLPSRNRLEQERIPLFWVRGAFVGALP